MPHPDPSEVSPKLVYSEENILIQEMPEVGEGARTDLERLLEGANADYPEKVGLEDSNGRPNFLFLIIMALSLVLISLGIHVLWPLP